MAHGNIERILSYPKEHAEDIVAVAVAAGQTAAESYIASVDAGSSLCLWDLKGHLMRRLDAQLVANFGVAVSPCRRFVAACGWAPEVPVWEVRYDKGGAFADASRVMTLGGHSSQAWGVAFSGTAAIVTAGKDGRAHVDYVRWRADPRLLASGPFPVQPGAGAVARVALSPDGTTLAVGQGSCLQLLAVLRHEPGKADGDAADGMHETIDPACAGHITSLAWSPDSTLLAYGATERHVHVARNVPGRQARLAQLRAALRQAGSESARERLGKQIAEVEQELATWAASANDA